MLTPADGVKRTGEETSVPESAEHINSCYEGIGIMVSELQGIKNDSGGEDDD